MSVAFDSNSGMIKGDGWSLMDIEEKSKCREQSQRFVWWIGAAAGCMGLLCLLLLAVILGLVAKNTRANIPQDTHPMASQQINCENLTSQWSQSQMSYNTLLESTNQLQAMFSSLTKDRDSLRQERDILKFEFNNLTKEMELLQSRFSGVVATRDELQEELNMIHVNRSDKLCAPDWIKFRNKCYYVSDKTTSKTWKGSKKDCEDRGAYLVIINSKDEQNFVSRFYDRTWIGLSDTQHEGKFRWVNGAMLEGDEFWQKGEPNNTDGQEDCVELSRGGGGWNDMPCNEDLSWVCEM